MSFRMSAMIFSLSLFYILPQEMISHAADGYTDSIQVLISLKWD